MTRSTRLAARSATLRPPQEGQKLRVLHENSTSRASIRGNATPAPVAPR